MHYCKPAGPLDELNERELNSFKNMTHHKELSIAAAMDYCDEHELCPPPWLVAASAELMIDLIRREKAQKCGRTAGHLARYRQDFFDIERYDAVIEIRRMRKKARRNVKAAQSHPAYPKSRLKSQEKMLAWFKGDNMREYECAAMYLTGRDAKIGREAMKASYRKVRDSFFNPATALRYSLFDDRFLRKLGLQGLTDRKPGTKWWPLSDLTC